MGVGRKKSWHLWELSGKLKQAHQRSRNGQNLGFLVFREVLDGTPAFAIQGLTITSGFWGFLRPPYQLHIKPVFSLVGLWRGSSLLQRHSRRTPAWRQLVLGWNGSVNRALCSMCVFIRRENWLFTHCKEHNA